MEYTSNTGINRVLDYSLNDYINILFEAMFIVVYC